MTSFRAGFLLAAITAPFLVMAQGYQIVATADLPNPITLTADVTTLTIAPFRDDVRALGVGSAQIAGGRSTLSMLSNPGLLARERTSVDVLNIGLGLPVRTLDALTFINDNIDQFKTGAFFSLIEQGYEEFRTATTAASKLSGLQKMRQGLAFPRDLVSSVSGSSGNLRTHGITAMPAIAAQVDSWGVSVSNTLQLGFQVAPGTAISELSSLDIPDDPSLVAPSVIFQLLGTLGGVFDPFGNVRTEALPRVFAVSYNDIVGTVGRGFRLSDRMSAGVAVKVVNRRFSSKLIDPENVEHVLSEVRQEFTSSVTGVTLDGGGTFELDGGTRVGLSFQNVLPLQKVASTAAITFRGGLPFYLDGSAQPTTDPNAALVGHYDKNTQQFTADAAGDTMLYVVNYRVDARLPVELRAPMVASIGVAHPLSGDWDVAVDWHDVFSNDERFESFAQRIRLGTEYRLFSGLVALRGGLGYDHFTGGLGIDLRYVKIDGATAFDPFTQARSYYAQIALGW